MSSYADHHLLPALKAANVPVIDLRTQLPRNTQYARLRQWDTRPVEAIHTALWHYVALPLRPPAGYDEIARIKAIARAHIERDWSENGTGWHAPTISYHWFIGGSGIIYLLNDLERVTWHGSDANGFSLAVCVDVGKDQPVLLAQELSMQALANVLNAAPGMPLARERNYGHGEDALRAYIPPTACPGAVRPYIEHYRRTGFMVAPPTPYLDDWQRDMLSLMEPPLFLNADAVRKLINDVPALEQELARVRKDELEPAQQQLKAAGERIAQLEDDLTIHQARIMQVAQEREAARQQVVQLQQEVATLKQTPPVSVTKALLQLAVQYSDGRHEAVPVWEVEQ